MEVGPCDLLRVSFGMLLNNRLGCFSEGDSCASGTLVQPAMAVIPPPPPAVLYNDVQMDQINIQEYKSFNLLSIPRYL